MELNVWDAGGQERYLERYFSENQRELIFSEVTTAIFMVDSTVTDSRIREIFEKFLEYLVVYSPHIEKIYILLNKIDLPTSQEDNVYKILTDNLSDDFIGKLAFTPVSVKEGSAQHRLIEILDYEIQKSTLFMQRLGKIRYLLDQLKMNTLSEYLLFNHPDGLLISSTFGKFESQPLEFMKFEISTLDSNLYNIYQKIMELLNIPNITPLSLSTIIWESDNCYLLVKEVSDSAILMAITKNKNLETFSGVMKALTGEDFERLKNFIVKGEN
jgi:GTPase SAR1 family protein